MFKCILIVLASTSTITDSASTRGGIHMDKSSISADVKAANSRLAQFLRRKEEEEMLLQIGKRKPKELKEKRYPGGRARWAVKPNFYVPTPMVDRPRTVTGATSFHFSCITISKQAVPTVDGKPLGGSFGKLREAALEHSKYIERDGAAEMSYGAHNSAGAQHAAYVERPGVIENIDPSALMDEAIERTIVHVINETPTVDEAVFLGIFDVSDEEVPSVFTNISHDPFERQEFWRAVERCERKPKTHQLILDPETSPRWWNALPDTEQLDLVFKNHALLVAEKYRQYLDAPVPDGGTKKPFKVDPYTVSAERAGTLIKQAMSMPGFDHSLPPIEFKSGRGGRVQTRFVAELPHELTPEDRALVVQNFCDRLTSLEERKDPDGTIRKVGMMYTAVNAPDTLNDSRNYHLHVVAHDRPARFIEEHGMWDFEVQEHFTLKGMDRVRYPYRQNKIGEIARPGNGADYERSGKNLYHRCAPSSPRSPTRSSRPVGSNVTMTRANTQRWELTAPRPNTSAPRRRRLKRSAFLPSSGSLTPSRFGTMPSARSSGRRSRATEPTRTTKKCLANCCTVSS